MAPSWFARLRWIRWALLASPGARGEHRHVIAELDLARHLVDQRRLDHLGEGGRVDHESPDVVERDAGVPSVRPRARREWRLQLIEKDVRVAGAREDVEDHPVWRAPLRDLEDQVRRVRQRARVVGRRDHGEHGPVEPTERDRQRVAERRGACRGLVDVGDRVDCALERGARLTRGGVAGRRVRLGVWRQGLRSVASSSVRGAAAGRGARNGSTEGE